jgi:hypothetical protein
VPSWAAGVAVVVVGTVGLLVAFRRTLVDYDISWALVWGRELMGGHLPSYEAAGAPTPHPLTTAVGAVASLFGSPAGFTVMLVVAFAGYAALVWGVFRLGQLAFSWHVGVVGAIAVATSFPLVSDMSLGFFDVATAALVVLAAVLEVQSPRRGAVVLLLLAIAGLQRPEVWLLGGAYWLYLAPSLSWQGRARTAAIAAAAPVVWLLSDLAITGDLSHSFGVTRQFALDPQQGASLPEVLRHILRWPVLAVGGAGLVLALLFERSRARVPVGLAVTGVASLAVLDAAGIALLFRFGFATAAALGVLFGFATMGWIGQPPGRRRSAWAVLGTLAALAALASVRPHFNSIRGLPDERERRGIAGDDLRSLTNAPSTGAALRGCDQIAVPTGLLRPFLANDLDRDIGEMVSFEDASGSAAYILPVGPEAKEVQLLQPLGRPTPRLPKSLTAVGGNRSWRLYTRDC